MDNKYNMDNIIWTIMELWTTTGHYTHSKGKTQWLPVDVESNSSCLEQATRKQVAQLSQRDRAAGWVSYGQKWKNGTGRQYLRTI